MNTRSGVFVAVVVLAVVGATGYVIYSRRAYVATTDAATSAVTRNDVAAVSAVPHVVFRNTVLGQGYGQVALVPLDDPEGPRVITSASCDRVYAAASVALCIAADRGLVTTYRAQLLDTSWTPKRDLPLTGLPSRARIARDGTLAATTTFVFGDSYANPGHFSTRTLVSTVAGSGNEDLEQFQLVIDGRTVTATDRNIWGVTFADDDHFYATAAVGDKTWLVQGSLSKRTLTAIRGDVECPSLSPDKTRIAFKKHGDLPHGTWRLAVYDLVTGKETLLAEGRTVDDQAEWLNDTQVIYGLPRGQSGTASSDVWTVPADGTGSPTKLISDAWSPAVVR